MVRRVITVLRLVSVVGAALVGAQQVRNMYDERRGVWNVLRRLIRQQG
jgi:hypothetical protein